MATLCRLVEAAGLFGHRPHPFGASALRCSATPYGVWSNPLRGFVIPAPKTPKGRLMATLCRLVEAAGIEPASASTPLSALHA
jgi:hypothetical protein